MTWVGMDGWPRDFPDGLREAILSLPGSDDLSPDEVNGLASRIAAAAIGGADLERNRNRPASLKASESELRRLHELCGKLVDAINSMHRPAIDALTEESADVFTLAGRLEEMQASVRCAISQIEPRNARGAPTKARAAEVTREAAAVYTQVTGTRPTITTDTRTSEVSGAWPDFLQMVFYALNIHASVASQVRGVVK